MTLMPARRLILVVWLLGIAASAIYPPWRYLDNDHGPQGSPAPRHLVFQVAQEYQPPEYDTSLPFSVERKEGASGLDKLFGLAPGWPRGISRLGAAIAAAGGERTVPLYKLKSAGYWTPVSDSVDWQRLPLEWIATTAIAAVALLLAEALGRKKRA